jgi:hypothetical protein
MKDVFISYSLNDKSWVKAELLTRFDKGSITYFDQHMPELGLYRDKALENAITQSRYVLLIITSGYLSDSWDDFTNVAAFNFMLERNGKGGNSLRVIPAYKEVVPELPMRIRTLTSIDLSEADDDVWKYLTSTLSAGREEADKGDCIPAQTPEPILRDTRDVLGMLFELRWRPEVSGPFGRFEAEFRNMREQIKSLNQHKKLHDLFQQLENEINVVGTFCYGPRPDDPVDWERLDMIDSLAKIADLVAAIIRQAVAASFATQDDVWVQRLLRGMADFSLAVGGSDGAKLRAAMRRIQEVLNTVPAKVNAQLVTRVKSLRLTALERTLLTVHDNLKALDVERVTINQLEQIKRAAEQVDELDRSLQAYLFLHDSLQQIEVELRGAEPFVGEDVERITDAWEFVWPKLQSICDGVAFGWEAELISLASELEGSFSPEKQAGIKKAFYAVRRKVTRIFNRVDTDMLERCDQLEEEIGVPLTPLLAVMQGFTRQ